MISKSNFRKSRNQLEGYSKDLHQPGPSVPDAICQKCPACGEMVFETELEERLRVCPKCGHHMRLSALQRIASVCDDGCFEPWDEGLQSCDALEFPGYAAKLKNLRLQSKGAKEAVVTGKASIGGEACALFAMDPNFMMGSMGSVVGEKITRLFERAEKERLPVVGFTLSGGARMQEGMFSLMQMAKTSGAVKRHSDAGLLYVTVLTDPTTGGVTASFAMEGDILLSEPGALIAFAGPRVVEQTIRQKLPKNFQRAEFLLEHGFLDAVIPRRKMKNTLTKILRLHREEPQEENRDGSL